MHMQRSKHFGIASLVGREVRRVRQQLPKELIRIDYDTSVDPNVASFMRLYCHVTHTRRLGSQFVPLFTAVYKTIRAHRISPLLFLCSQYWYYNFQIEPQDLLRAKWYDIYEAYCVQRRKSYYQLTCAELERYHDEVIRFCAKRRGETEEETRKALCSTGLGLAIGIR